MTNSWIYARSCHYEDVTMSGMASQITSLTIVYSTVYTGAAQRKHQSPTSLAFVRGLHRGPVNSQHKWPVTRKHFPFDDVIMLTHWRLPTAYGVIKADDFLLMALPKLMFNYLQLCTMLFTWGHSITDMNWNIPLFKLQPCLPSPYKLI